jgi:hypothetical protein
MQALWVERWNLFTVHTVTINTGYVGKTDTPSVEYTALSL